MWDTNLKFGRHLMSKSIKDLLKSKYGLTKPIKHCYGDFGCSYNQLTSLEGAPSSVGGSFDCSHNQLTSLKGAPSSVGGDFYCINNNLTSLEGAPNSVGENFGCRNNNLTSLEGAPSSVGGDFSCRNNKKQFTEEEVRIVCKVNGKVYV
jgi:hypothetical protein